MARKAGRHERFILYRQTDVTGVSGKGTVAEGVEWSDGTVTIRWCVEGKPRFTNVGDSIAAVEEIHGHDGKTQVIWDL